LIDVTVDSSLNTRTGNVPDADSISFGKGLLHFGWDNYVIETPDGVATTGGLARVTYGYLRAGESAATYQGASLVEQVIFSFATPKSAGKNYFLWDPVITVNAGPSLVPLFGMVITILSVMFLF